jgi:dTDP-4-amino-4,6-dideoxygalactose transaminase
MPVHLYGQPVDVQNFKELSEKTSIPVIYDSAHAFGSSVDGKRIGNFGLAESFSFHATKLMTTIEGGALVTNNIDLAREFRLFTDFGIRTEEEITGFGTNAKMNEISAVIGLHSLRNLSVTIEKRKRLYSIYRKELMDVPGISLLYSQNTDGWNYHYVAVLIDENTFGLTRDVFYDALKADNIFARRYFWPPCHQLPAFCEETNNRNILPVTDFVANHVLCLPISSAYSIETIEKICSSIRVIQNSSERITALFKKGECGQGPPNIER